MKIKDVEFVPLSDVGANDIEIINEHKKLINDGNYSGATALLDEVNFEKGVRASLFNSFQNKLRNLELYFLNSFVAEKDEYFSYEEPDENFMNDNGYTHWLKPWD